MPLVAIDTSKQAILDVDKIEIFKQFYPKIYKKLNKECVYYLSRNKRLPHFLIQIEGLANDAKNRIVLQDGCADLLIGQWAWCRSDEIIVSEDREIVKVQFDELIINNDNNKKVKTTEYKTRINNESANNTKHNFAKLKEIFESSKYCTEALKYDGCKDSYCYYRGQKPYSCEICNREHVKNSNRVYLFEKENGYFMGCRNNIVCLKPKVLDNLELIEKSFLDNYEILEINSKYVSYNSSIFENNDTIVVSSCAGTGKTTNTSKQIKQYLKKHPDMKILNISNYISLSRQITESFKKDGIVLTNYQNSREIDLRNGHHSVVLNSLIKLVENIDFEKTILYIDEVSSLIKSLCENDLLDRNLKLIYLI
jgi:hypothetical protein